MKLYELVEEVPYDSDLSFGFFGTKDEAAQAKELLIAVHAKDGHNKTQQREFRNQLQIKECQPQTLDEFKKEWIE